MEEKKQLGQPSKKRIFEIEQAVDKLVDSSRVINKKQDDVLEGVLTEEQSPSVSLTDTFDTEEETPLDIEVIADDFTSTEELTDEALCLEVPSGTEPNFQDERLKHQFEELSKSMTTQFSSIELILHKVMRDFQTKMMVDAQKDQIIDNLHRELQDYKNNENQDRFLPLIRDLIDLIDNLKKHLGEIEKHGYEHPESLVKLIKYTAQDVEDILYRQGIEALPYQKGKLDTKRHKVVKTIKTADIEKDKQIAEVFGKAYSWDERQIRPELVAVYGYQPNKEVE
ncbi:nucleotide exchange factor GrpE [Litchfieldia alkalitelluris]|uniref:nucleotide exchange factor GrpE n=1 Tax=Litchfieldia alkalitelluris TaxID=304268 RepID=UPI0014748D63|nr:nucleotide exchange factor GrpE [Litchfieldia alkalitelluris]